jgi:eukaryotic-like serine/threonine-protein kinase
MSEHLAGLADALCPRYALERRLQSGVAAHVFVAEDRVRGRRVAVKILREEMSATIDAERFLAEIRICAQLQHPNIVPVYDSGRVPTPAQGAPGGQDGGVPYFVMPYVDGETLRARLTREGRLPLDEALRIAEDVACALHFAHRRQVVHRDIKPENIMLCGGRALLLDFGIALALDAVDDPRRTLPGLTIGTVEYMSPEQAAGESPVDGRSDIYSLACVVYEMLCGRPEFSGSRAAV